MPLDNLDNSQAFVDNSQAQGKVAEPVPKPNKEIGIDTENAFLQNIAQAGISSQIDISTIQSFTRVSQSRNQIYDTIDTMCEDSLISAILETYAEDATEYNDQGQIVWVESEDANIFKHINYMLETMRIDKHIYKWVHALCKYGDVYLRLYRQSDFNKDNVFDQIDDNKKKLEDKLAKLNEAKLSGNKAPLKEDVVIKAYASNDHYVNYLELVPNPAEMFELTRFGKTSGYIEAEVSNTNVKTSTTQFNTILHQYKFKRNDVKVYSATEFVHASLEDSSNRIPEEVNIFLDDKSYDDDDGGITYTVKRGQSLFQNVFKVWRELSLLENSILLNRVTKSAITRLINVEVGDMPKEMVGPHLQGIKALMEQKAAINEGNSISEYTNPGPAENNIYVPTNGGKGVITATTVGGDVNVGDLVDLDYFKNKFFGAMRVPKQYFGDTDDGAGFNGGQSLSIISSRYAKMVKRIQNTILQALTDAVNLMLLDRGLDNYIGKFNLRMLPPTTQEEIDRRENVSSKIALTRDTMDVLADVDDPVTKLKILKSLLSDVITDGDVISTLEEFINKLEAEIENVENMDMTDDADNQAEDDGSNMPLNLGGGSEGGTDDAEEFVGSEEEVDIDTDDSAGEEDNEDDLPTPEELGAGDLSDNNNPDI